MEGDDRIIGGGAILTESGHAQERGGGYGQVGFSPYFQRFLTASFIQAVRQNIRLQICFNSFDPTAGFFKVAGYKRVIFCSL